MADISKINNYDIKDAVARTNIEELQQNKADKTEIPQNVSELNNDAGYLTEHQDISDYVTKDEMDDAIYNIDPDRINLEGYATVEHVDEVMSLYFKDPHEEEMGYEGIDVFSISEGTVKMNGTTNAVYYRIPALTVSSKGTIVAFTDVRYDTAADNAGRISIFCRRSEDKGKTWGDPIEVCKYPTNADGSQASVRARSMDSTVIASKSGRLLCLNGAWKSNINNWSTYTNTPDPDWQFKLSISNDDGKTWTTRNLNEDGTCKNIPSTLVSMLGGVGQGIQMYDGTLVFPVQMTVRESNANRVCATIMYSKDDGLTWTVASGDAKATSGENNVVEIEPGVIMMNARNGSIRQTFVTRNMGQTWSVFNPLNALIGNGSVGCQGSSTKVKLECGKEIFLHSSPINNNNNYTRDNITLYASYNWDAFDKVVTYYPVAGDAAGAGYSCLAPAIIDGQYCLFALYERQGNIAFRNLSNYLEIIAQRCDEYFAGLDRRFEYNKSELFNLFLELIEDKDVLLEMIELYKNGELSAGPSEPTGIAAELAKAMQVSLSSSSSGVILNKGLADSVWERNGDFVADGTKFSFNKSTQNYIVCYDYNPVNNFTVDFDVYINGAPGVNWSFLFAIAKGTEVPRLGLGINSTDTWNPAVDGNGAPTYTETSFVGRWIHLTITKSSSAGVVIYQDNEQVWEHLGGTGDTSAADLFVIGNNGAFAKSFDGIIANFKVYDKVVSEEERAYLFDNRYTEDVSGGTDPDEPEIEEPDDTGIIQGVATTIPSELATYAMVDFKGTKPNATGGVTVYDAGTQAVDWTIGGNVTYSADNNMFVFDGSSTANTIHAKNFLANDFTVDFDVYIDSAPGVNWSQIFAIGAAAGGNLPCALAINGTDTWNPAIAGNGSNTYTETSFVGRWIHLSICKSSTSGMTIYQDGAQVWNSQAASTPVQGTDSVASYDTIAVGNNPNPVKKFIGKIANFRIYNKVFATTEASLTYQNGKSNA